MDIDDISSEDPYVEHAHRVIYEDNVYSEDDWEPSVEDLAQALRAAYRERPGQILVVVMTDGGLSNTSDALSVFGDIVADGNHVVLLHIGKHNAFTTGMEKLGCSTHLLTDAGRLVGLCLDLAKERYQVLASRQMGAD